MIVSFALTFLGGQDAINSTISYNKLDLTNPIKFRINNKYNKKENGQSFPDLNFRGIILGTDNEKEIKVSRGDFDQYEIGQIINIYKTKSDEFITEQEIDNQGIIHIGKTGYSFVFIPTFIFFIIGLFCLIIILKKEKRKANTDHIV